MKQAHALTQKLIHQLSTTPAELGFFAILIALALFCDIFFNYLGSFSTVISIFTSLLFIYSIFLIGVTGLRFLTRTHHKLTRHIVITEAKELSQTALHILPAVALIIAGTALGIALVIIPGILFILRTMFVVASRALQNTTVKESFKFSLQKTSRLTKDHLLFYVMFGVNIFLFVYSSSIISDQSFSIIFLLIILPLLIIVSLLTAQHYLKLFNKPIAPSQIKEESIELPENLQPEA